MFSHKSVGNPAGKHFVYNKIFNLCYPSSEIKKMRTKIVGLDFKILLYAY